MHGTSCDTRFSKEDAAHLAAGIATLAPAYADKLLLGEAIYAHVPDLVRIILAQHDLRQGGAPKIDGTPPACPAISNIKAVQLTVWDNWKEAQNKVGNQFGLTFELWDDTVEKLKLSNYTFKCQAALMAGKQLKSHIRKNMRGKVRAYPLSEAYLDILDTLARTLEPQTYVALLNTNIKENVSDYKRGICYHDDQFVLLKGDPLNGQIEKCTLYIGENKLDLNYFSKEPYGKRAFNRRIAIQSRIDLCDFFPAWSTNSLDSE